MNEEFLKPTAIIFDFDDTLVNAKPILNKAICATFSHFDIDQKILQNVDTNRSLRDYFRSIFADNLLEAREVYYRYYKEFADALAPMDNALEVLKFLQKQRVFTAIVSNKDGATLRAEIKNKLNWEEYFMSVIGAGDAKKDKPSHLPGVMALQNAALNDYEHVWLIGDSLVDVQTAENLGCKAILFGDLVLQDQDKIYARISDHAQLLKLFEKIYV